MSGTIAEKPKNAKYPHLMKFEVDLYVMFLTTFQTSDFKVIMLRCFKLLHANHFLTNGR